MFNNLMRNLFLFAVLFFQFGCGISFYPGQPGIVTNGTAKLDLEVLDDSGLWVYEVDYDNRIGGGGVKSIVTKLYPGALTYTSNVRTNSEGTLFRHKFESQDAEIQMISFPKKKQVIFPEDTKVILLAEYQISSDEVDDRNVAEADIFSQSDTPSLSSEVLKQISLKVDWIRAGEMQPNGRLSYRIVEIDLGGKKLSLTSPVTLETNVIQTGVFLNLSEETRKEFVVFLDKNFPDGFAGMGRVLLDNAKELEVPLNLRTRNSLKADKSRTVLVRKQSQMVSILENR